MKEFEKWWKQQPEHEYNPGEWYIIQKGWKAALEWALTQTVTISPINKPEYLYEVIPADIVAEELEK